MFRPQAKPNPYTNKYDKTATDYMGEQATAATPQPEASAAVHLVCSRVMQLLPVDVLTGEHKKAWVGVLDTVWSHCCIDCMILLCVQPAMKKPCCTRMRYLQPTHCRAVSIHIHLLRLLGGYLKSGQVPSHQSVQPAVEHAADMRTQGLQLTSLPCLKAHDQPRTWLTP